MEKELLKYLRCGRGIKRDKTEELYRTFRADFAKGVILACPNEQKFCAANAIVELRAEEVSSAEQIRFITPDYETLFVVENFDFVLFDGVPKRVSIHDEYHFEFIEDRRCFHIREFAELCVQIGKKVEPMKKE